MRRAGQPGQPVNHHRAEHADGAATGGGRVGGQRGATADPMVEKFYVADTGNNRIILYSLAQDDPTPTWNNMTNHIATGDISGAMQYFSGLSANKYQQAFVSLGSNNLFSAISQIGMLTPDYVSGDEAECYFTNIINGQTITFPVEFIKENGVWKIFEF